MNKNVILLLVIFAGASASVPALRERVGPRVSPVWEGTKNVMTPVVRFFINPIRRWAAGDEAKAVSRTLRQREIGGLALPSPQKFEEFMRKSHTTGREGRDPWGTPYALVLLPDSIVVISAGPDLDHGTPDDIRRGTARR